MLVLSRGLNESIVIGDQLVRIVVVDIRGDKVRLGFEASQDISIHRSEVYDAIQKNGPRNLTIKDRSNESTERG